MANLRFSFLNRIEAATLKNGTGGGAPARDETSPWLMENAQNRDRGHVWQGTSTSPHDVDYNLAATATLRVFAALGQRGAPSSSAGLSSIEVFTQAGAYSAGGTWTSRGTIMLGSGVRNGALVLGSDLTGVDSVRYRHTKASAFTLGRHFAGTIEQDLGIISSRGYLRRRVIPVNENRMGDRSPFVTQSGDPFFEFSIPYRSIPAATHAKLLQVGSQLRSFFMLDFDDAPHEVKLRDHTFAASLLWNQPAVYEADLELESLS